jgi:hypothetical protein
LFLCQIVPNFPGEVLWSWVTGYDPITVNVTRIPASDGVDPIVEQHLLLFGRGDITTIMNMGFIMRLFVTNVREIKHGIRLVIVASLPLKGKVDPVVMAL